MIWTSSRKGKLSLDECSTGRTHRLIRSKRLSFELLGRNLYGSRILLAHRILVFREMSCTICMSRRTIQGSLHMRVLNDSVCEFHIFLALYLQIWSLLFHVVLLLLRLLFRAIKLFELVQISFSLIVVSLRRFLFSHFYLFLPLFGCALS